jgi:hypothetical protein
MAAQVSQDYTVVRELQIEAAVAVVVDIKVQLVLVVQVALVS